MPNKYLDSEGLAEYTGLVKSALNLKADLASPALTGTPTAPTPTAGDDSTQIATTEFVQGKIAESDDYTDGKIAAEVERADEKYLPFAGGTITGNLTVSGTVNGVTPTAGDDSTKFATTEFVQDAKDEANDYTDTKIATEVTRSDGKYLPLAGGTMSGTIVWSGDNLNVIRRDNGNDGLCIIGGDTDNFSGATLQLFGQTNNSYAGTFYLRASTKSDVSDTSHPR